MPRRPRIQLAGIPQHLVQRGVNRERAAQGIQAEQRIGAGHQRHRLDRNFRNQVPADDIAERLVHAHPIHKDRQALRRSEQRRGGIAAVVDVRLKWIALHFVDVHAAVERYGFWGAAPTRCCNNED